MMLHSLRLRIVWTPLLVLLLAAAATGVMAGQYPMALSDVMWTLLRGLGLSDKAVDNAATLDAVIWNLRVPRTVAGALVGASLAAAGATYQGMFRNPLVSPDILGVSAGAGLGAAAAIFMGLSMILVQALAFAGGLAAVACVYFISLSVRRHDATLVLVLAGVAVGTLLGAGISLLKILADPYTQLPSITFWLLGGLNTITGSDIPLILPCLAIGLVPMVLMRWRVNLLSLSDDESQSLGVNTLRTRIVFIAAATLMTSGSVAFTGIIGWVGLVIPHVARILVGPDFSRLLPASALLGAAFLVFTDTLARTLVSIELPLGVLTALVGAPFFLMLLARGSRE
ncbi:FecCD family ABC transporter permease [Pusillimonas noertemannii]|uniref:Iron complex transport system permease protein n=1 Tax=Pusillimonas noertemannii TaxID=305977 RepID=A0A2U1CRN9_9BURK|nr:iron ABC transporter permease [Pusillimonas noertemannii]NYT67869.1 iron ABC transporter permease [Pusillimonas noertemannii]PVY68539.1 iron complex transport system permease protein [Pusillimonas noertemannii]TFL11987.1 iron ABC transporter permease [Pusillimonas noertemannii]